MDIKDVTGIVPEQYTGREIISEETIDLNSAEEAKDVYQRARARLLDVNHWNRNGSIPGTNFQVMDSDGEKADRNVEEFDYFRITVPGPASREGDGYDWVHVEELREVDEEDVQSIAFRVRPTSNPESPRKETAHFYSDESTSTFMVTRHGNQVTVQIIDRNISANDEASSTVDKIRDKALAIGGMAGMSKMQWQGLARGILQED